MIGANARHVRHNTRPTPPKKKQKTSNIKPSPLAAALSPLQKKSKTAPLKSCAVFDLKPVVRVELTTVRLQIGCSTTELNRRSAGIVYERNGNGKLEMQLFYFSPYRNANILTKHT